MKRNLLYAIILTSMVLIGCSKDEDVQVATLNIEGIEVESSYKTAVVTWNIQSNATIQEAILELSADSSFAQFKETKMAKIDKQNNTYRAQLSGLTEGTKYYIRCKALNKVNSCLSESSTFSTQSYSLAEIRSDSISNITTTSADLYGSLCSWGTDTIPSVGFYFGTHPDITEADSCLPVSIDDSADTISFQYALSNLDDNTTYYMRAYAKNSKGVAWGEELTFTTVSYRLPTVITSDISNISYTTATCAGEVIEEGDGVVIEKGVCYSISPSPTIEDQKIACGSGGGTFTCDLTNLTIGTTYYVRAYAQNFKGTAYGIEKSFVTAEPPSVITYTASQKLEETTSTDNDGEWHGGLHVNCFGDASITSHEFFNGNGTILFNKKLTIIGYNAFYYCTQMTSITIPNSVTNIGQNAFRDCTSLSTIIIPDNVSNIESGAFYNCTSLTSIIIPYGVSCLENETFGSCTNLSSVTLPNSIATIKSFAFELCSNLTSIEIPNSVVKIQYGAFHGCSNLTSITIPSSVTDLEPMAFRYCANLSTICVDPENPKYDSRGNCNAIIETTTNTFVHGCKNSYIPNDIIDIGAAAFQACINLTSIIIPDNVVHIGGDAFAYCANLSSLLIGTGVDSIGGWAFYECTSLSSISCKAVEPPACAKNMSVFGKVNKSIPLYVPAASVSAYQQAEAWKEFTNIQPISE